MLKSEKNLVSMVQVNVILTVKVINALIKESLLPLIVNILLSK